MRNRFAIIIGLLACLLVACKVEEPRLIRPTTKPFIEQSATAVRKHIEDAKWITLINKPLILEEEIEEEPEEEITEEAPEEEPLIIDNPTNPFENPTNPIDETPGLTSLGVYEITAYEWTGNPCANGNYPAEGYTVACNDLPLGTEVWIEGIGYRVVEDTGGGGPGWMDLYLGDVDACYEWGRQYREVYIYE